MRPSVKTAALLKMGRMEKRASICVKSSRPERRGFELINLKRSDDLDVWEGSLANTVTLSVRTIGLAKVVLVVLVAFVAGFVIRELGDVATHLLHLIDALRIGPRRRCRNATCRLCKRTVWRRGHVHAFDDNCSCLHAVPLRHGRFVRQLRVGVNLKCGGDPTHIITEGVG